MAARETLTARDETLAARDEVLPARDETLDARDQTLALGITVDNSVGTRVFVGDTMIHGDTGWRDISEYMIAETTGTTRIFIRRLGGVVYLSADSLHLAARVPGNTALLAIPAGFRSGITFRIGSGATYELNSAIYSSAGGLEIHTRGGIEPGRRRFYVDWVSDKQWPASLPGSPA